MRIYKSFLSLVLALMFQSTEAFVTSGDYYIVNDFFSKALGDDGNGGIYLSSITDETDELHIFEALNPSGDYVMLRNKSTGKYLTASTSDSWSIALSEEGTGDQYYWKFEQQFSTKLVSKKNANARVGCDFKSGNTYYWSSDFVPVYYNKGVSGMNWFSIIPSNGNGYEASRKVTKTDVFTNEYGVKEQDVYCVTDNLVVSGADLHVISLNAFDGGSVDITGDGYWLILDNIRPSQVDLSSIKINGSRAIEGSNCRVEMYLRGAAIIPLPSYPFEASGKNGSFRLGLGNHSDLGDDNNSMTSFTLKRGYMATVASGKNGGGYSRVYVADHEDLYVSLPRALEGRVSSVNIRNWHYTAKCGYAGNGEAQAKAIGGSWYWNWDANRSSSADVEYVPIKQHLWWPGDGDFNKQASTAMMLFNEPEHSEQHTSGKCSCGGTINAWTAYEQTPKFNSTGLRIGSPSATDLSYIKEYDKNCDNMAQRCDFNCTHGYWTTEWSNSLSTLQSYGKPIWITEWEYGASWTSGSNPSSTNDAADKVLGILDMLEYNDYVERYSYYEFDTGGSNGWCRELFWENNVNKGCAPVGDVHRRIKPHLGYKASIQPVPNWWAPTFVAPSINKVYLSEGKYTLSLNNAYGDAASSISIQKKNDSSWDTIAEISDRTLFDDTTLGIDIPSDILTESCTLRAVVSSIYESGTKESAEYAYVASVISDAPLDMIKNLAFDEGTLISVNINTYAKDNKSSDVSGEQPVEAWIANDPNADAHASGLIAWGSSNTVSGSTAPAENSEGTTSGAGLAVVSCWTSTTQYTQDVVFPAGTYTLTVPVYNAAGTAEISKNLIGFIADSGAEFLSPTKSFSIGWTTETITFTLSGMTSGKLSVGYRATNSGSGNMPHLFIDGMTISDGTDTWPKAPVFYTITFKDKDDNEISSEQYEENAEITAPTAPEVEGYTFTGWDAEVVPVTADATYTAQYSINSYSLIYELDAEQYNSLTLEYGADVTPLDSPADREGYTFSGWTDEPTKMPAEDVTVKGSFIANSYSLIYLLDGAEYQIFTIDYGTPITPLEDPTKEGYEFSGWSEIPSTMPAEDVTVTGTFAYIAPDAIAHFFAGVQPVAIFTPEGVRIPFPRKGLNIFRLTDGTIKKIFVK